MTMLSPKSVYNLNMKNRYLHFFYSLFANWLNDKVSTLSAAFAYFTIFSLAPLLFIGVTIVGLIFGKSMAEAHTLSSLSSAVGPSSASEIAQMIQSQKTHSTSIIATLVSIAVLLFGAIGFFSQLLDGLNIIFGVQPKPGQGFIGVVRTRFFAFVSILVMTLLLFLSIIISACMGIIQNHIPAVWLFKAIHLGVSLGVITLFFLLLYKYLPDIKLKLSEVWLGALVAAILFVLGQWALGWYFKHAALSNQYGVAASLVIIIFWLYYFGQILYIGAEFIKAYLAFKGRTIIPNDNAAPIHAGDS